MIKKRIHLNKILLAVVVTFLFTNAVSAKTTADNYALSLPGGSGASSHINISGLALNTLPFTVEMWIKPEGSQAAYAGLFYHRGASTNAGLYYAAGWEGANMLRLDYNDKIVSNAINYDVWHHIAIVVSASSKTIYVDGEALATNTTTNADYDFSTGELYVGFDKAVDDRTFKGLIDEVRIWNTEKTVEQLEASKALVLNGDEEGLIAYYNFNDKTQGVATDLTGANNGTITGGTYVASIDVTDIDGDGILAYLDNCPETANADQADIDFNGIGDVCDDEIEGDGLYDIVTGDGFTSESGTNFVSFQQNAIMTFRGFQYITYWNIAGNVCIARKEFPDGKWDELVLTDYTSSHDLSDNHYNISMGICENDGTIHLAFDHHNDALKYRVSVGGLANSYEVVEWTEASFGAVRNYLENGVAINDAKFAGAVTYPRFVSKPNGNMLFECRTGWSGDGNSHLWNYSGTTNAWEYMGEYMHGRTGSTTGYTSKCGYINGLHYTPGGTRLHVSLVWRETPTASTNHDVYYAYSDDDGMTWQNSAGKTIASINENNPLHYDMDGFKIMSINEQRGLINQEGQVADSKGGIHILQSYMLSSEANSSNWLGSRQKAYMHHIYQDANGNWKSDKIAPSLIDRGDIAVDANDNLFVLGPDYRVYWSKASENWATWYEFDVSQDGKSVAEGLFDKEMLLQHNTLSFALAHSDMNGKIIVPHYKIELSGLGNAAVQEPIISIQPNPFQAFCSINIAGEFSYNIYSVEGKLLQSGFGNGSTTVGEQLASGAYILKTENNGHYITSKLIKQ